MTPARLRKACLALAGAEETFPFDADNSVFKVGGKIFAILDRDSVSLKCDPGYAAALREQYPAITPGYHLNKRHWNTVRLDGSIPQALLDELIQESYDLIVASLPRAARPT